MKRPGQTDSTTRRHRLRRLWLGLIGGVVLTIALGVVGILFPLTQTLDRWSYDLPFLWRSPLPTDEVVIIHMDAGSGLELGQGLGAPWDRRLHARLINRLTEDGARLVVYDVLFLTPGPEAAADEALVAALRRNGRVVLAGGLRQVATSLDGTNRVVRNQPLPPLRIFREAARAWGSAAVPQEPDFGRFPRPDTNMPDVLPLSFVAARELQSKDAVIRDLSTQERWINHLGRASAWNSHTFSRALSAPQNFAWDKIVFVGALPERGFYDLDAFATPYSRFGDQQMPGVKLHATMLLNLLRGDWLTRAGMAAQLLAVVFAGLVLGAACVSLNPRRSALLCVVAASLVTVISFLLVWRSNVWWSWLVPVAMQTPAAFAWGLGYRYFVVDQRSRRLKRAFGSYLSPVMADQLAEQEELLALGGKEIEATVMFTDLEGFTKMSEALAPTEVSKILTTYFNQTTRAILDQDGTIIKYIGDAVMAVWGAPLADPKHAERAVLAAWGMHEAGKQEVHGRLLRTRIGVNTGRMLAGNLGSDFRFDYTLIGDTINFASRLEGLNKFLGTDILISEATHAQIGKQIKVRPLGKFLVSGKKTPVGILEVLGPAERFPSDPLWLMKFAEALERFWKRELEAGEQAFREVITLRGADGPAEFYLKEIAKAGTQIDEPGDWDGTVRVDSK